MALQSNRTRTAAALGVLGLLCLLPDLAFAQATSPFLTGATALQTNILAWLTPIAVILVMVLGAMAMANRMLKSLAARIVFAPKDFTDAREISDELGFQTVAVKTVSKPIGANLDRRGSRSRSESVSEQRRALLLPQEVKELGSEEAIVFYEGLRPIRCRKIRYFTDRRFRRRLLPPPEVMRPARVGPWSVGPPAPMPRATPPVDIAGSQAPGAAVPPRAVKENLVIREGTVADVDRLESLTLKDFATDFSKVPIPDKEGPLTDGEMKIAVDAFVNSVRT